MGHLIQHSTRSARCAARGFTLFELIMTLVVVSILTAVAVPAMREFRIRANVSTTTNDLVVALNMARAEAVKRGRNVAVVAAGGGWTGGWTVQPVGTTETLISRPPVEDSYSVLGAPTGGGAPTDRVIFGATGALVTATAFDFSVCRPSFSPSAEQSRRILIASTGTIRSRRNTTGSPAGSCS
jgi:type IV fimbrial biogenesis protein FimT